MACWIFLRVHRIACLVGLVGLKKLFVRMSAQQRVADLRIHGLGKWSVELEDVIDDSLLVLVEILLFD